MHIFVVVFKKGYVFVEVLCVVLKTQCLALLQLRVSQDQTSLPIYEVLADFLHKLHTGQNTESEYSSLLLSLLQNLINNLKCPEFTFKGRVLFFSVL